MNNQILDEEVIEAIRLLRDYNLFVVKSSSVEVLAEPYINLIEPSVELERRKETRKRFNKALYAKYGYGIRLDISVFNHVISTIRTQARINQSIDFNVSLKELSDKFA